MTRQSSDNMEARVLKNARGDRVTLLNFGDRLASIELQITRVT